MMHFLLSLTFLTGYFLNVDRNLYTIRAVPFTEVRSIRRHTPAFGWQYVIVVLSSGKHILLSALAIHICSSSSQFYWKANLECSLTAIYRLIVSLTLSIDAMPFEVILVQVSM